ncbi:putative subtilisin-like protease precursor [Conidiobolus coronatus NRRL 28638]|uniref:Putative subtilisin-like protease n=1 Tax=Conidiobolus coronatus (strain ATCC 28846 / CBS 209.66 / NRRL 28638) TaxID=796925 RepID=A0A137NZB1_CONC2|nr:putative subtilisin-like protease precursor [Conidiobolus coronatus NRRL 28638]|eukprot:KXN67964.1 putative subtilisin-like protease precursor [Conidiobolus coronatus NRRL 28638]
MKFTAIFTTLSAFAVAIVSGEVIPGQYIISFDQTSRSSYEAQVASVTSLFTDRDGSNALLHMFNAAFYGVAVKLNPQTLEKVKTNPHVTKIEQDGIAKAIAIQSNAPWGLARVGQRPKLGASPYSYNHDDAGQGVTVFVLDTGVNISHDDFGGRATWGTNTAGGSDTDAHGHGTHCAGTIAGTTYGVAKKANIIAVKVLDDDGYGSYSGIISGIDWVVKHSAAKKVISMSLGGSKSDALNTAVNNAVNKDVVTVVAAGNDNRDACNYSPSSAPAAITVGATDINDKKASFSNYGKCVDILAPGVNILSTWKGSNTATNTISGTSMACPHVAGLAATVLSQGTSASGVDAKLKALATKNAISGFNTATPNALGFNGVSA